MTSLKDSVHLALEAFDIVFMLIYKAFSFVAVIAVLYLLGFPVFFLFLIAIWFLYDFVARKVWDNIKYARRIIWER